MLTADKKRYVVESTAPLSEALALIEANAHRSLIVLSPQGRVVGALSDGDVRKALLKGRLLVAPVHDIMNTNFIALQRGEVKRAKGIFQKTHIFLIPVVDKAYRLLDVLEAY